MATPQILEGFFAKAVVLVEGPTESLALPIYLERFGVVPARDGVAVIGVGGKGNLGKWRRLFTAFGIPTYVVFDNDGRRDDANGTKRKDALRAVGVPDDEHDAAIASNDWLVRPLYMVFGQNFEEALRAALPGYEVTEDEAEAAGVDAKPFVARWVAERLELEGPAVVRLQEFAAAVRLLLSYGVPAAEGGASMSSTATTPGRPGVSRPAAPQAR